MKRNLRKLNSLKTGLNFLNNYSFSGKITANKIEKFIEAAQKNKLNFYFESEVIPEKTFSERVVGEDFKQKVLKSNYDCVVLLEHPNDKENRGYGQKFEDYVKNTEKKENIKYYRIRDFNETEVFKFSRFNSPTILYFKKGDEKLKPRELNITRDLVKGSKKKDAAKRLDKFINENLEA